MKPACEPASSRPKPCASLKKPHESCPFAAPCGPCRKKNDRGQGGSYEDKILYDCVQSDIRSFGITGDWETMAVKAEVWVEAVTKGGRRFMAAWRQEEEDAARHRQEKREATRLGKLQSHTEA